MILQYTDKVDSALTDLLQNQNQCKIDGKNVLVSFLDFPITLSLS